MALLETAARPGHRATLDWWRGGSLDGVRRNCQTASGPLLTAPLAGRHPQHSRFRERPFPAHRSPNPRALPRLIRDDGPGVPLPSIEREAIAAAGNALDPESIGNYTGKALAAASQLCWQRESKQLVNAYRTTRLRPRTRVA